MKNKKTVAIILYAIYAVALVLIITFGTAVSTELIGRIENIFRKKDIADVTSDISFDDELLAGRYYYPKYTAHGSFRGSAGLEYESLDPDYLEVTSSGKLYVHPNFEGDSIDVRVKITTYYDEDFEKVLTYRFVKKYPDDFSVSYSVMGSGTDTGFLYVGVPIKVFADIAPGTNYNVTDHKIIYDEEYFEEKSSGYIVPIKSTNGEKLVVSIEYNNGTRADSGTFIILDSVQYECFDEIKLNGISAENFKGERNEPIEITLYENGNRIATDYSLSFAQKGDAKRDGKGGISFETVGDKTMTLTLPNGYAKTVHFGIENKLLLPTLRDELVRDTHVIDMITTDSKTFNFDFDGDVGYDTVTYEYDSDIIHFYSYTRTFTIQPKTRGTTTLKVIVDDGYRRLEDVYTINIREDMRLIPFISHHIGELITKVFGHAALFALLAIVAMNMFKYIMMENKALRFILYSLTALPIAAMTEIIQIFLPKRISNFSDVVIDMLGFYIGTLIVLFLKYIYAKCVKERKTVASE